jgi:hypothetical protein
MSFIASCLIIGGTPSSSKSQSNVGKPVPTQGEPSGEMKVLAAGFHSAVQNTFVAVIRDAEAYAQLRKLSPELPKLEVEFFQSRAVVAAFLGERNTGGYDIEIAVDGTGVRVTEKMPGKGMMVPQVITAPYKIVSFRAPGTSPVLVLYPASTNAMQSYSVRSGEFTNGGGFAGKIEHYGLEGKVEVIRQNNLVTLNFFLKNAGETNEHLLFETVTGVADSHGALTIKKISAGTLVSIPNGGLEAKGQFSNENTRLSLEFNPGPSQFVDGYGGGGVIEAIIIRPPQKP